MTSDVVVVIPARGGSKRAPRKNIREVGGKPLLAYAIVTAQRAGFGDVTFVSTDDTDIGRIAREWGAKLIDRPPELATDAASTESVLLHVLDFAARSGWEPEWVVTLPPTSPFRRPKTVAEFITTARGSDADCVFSLTESRGDFWKHDQDGRLVRLFPDAPRRQQERTPLYEENSAIYVTRADALRRTRSILGMTQTGIVIDPNEGFDINTDRDLVLAQALIDAGTLERGS